MNQRGRYKPDIDDIRNLLYDYYGTAMQENPYAVINLSDIEQMADEEIIRRAMKAGLIRIVD